MIPPIVFRPSHVTFSFERYGWAFDIDFCGAGGGRNGVVEERSEECVECVEELLKEGRFSKKAD